jgi:(E)-4-hydroxy-3-methylbut-2-enyl-diphosphate synthase
MEKIIRNKTRQIMCGNVAIGGDAKIVIQSMTNTVTKDVKRTVDQILELENQGCEIIRVAVADMEDAKAIKDIKKQIHIPIVADIHFDYKLALEALESGVDKLRLNPGNIGNIDNVRKVIEKAKPKNIPIRIGVNSGSIDKRILEKYHGHATAEGMVESALEHVKILEDLDYHNIAISLKSSDVKMTVEAYRLISKKVDYPLHVGVTESGTFLNGTIKSSIGIGSLLLDGIGDTIRVSLTDNPVEEIKVAKAILNNIGLRNFGVKFISCPTCGRTKIDLIELAKKVENALAGMDKDITVAIMGCVVNGPGEAKEADIGIAGGTGEALLFKKGEIIKKIPEDKIVEILLQEIERM